MRVIQSLAILSLLLPAAKAQALLSPKYIQSVNKLLNETSEKQKNERLPCRVEPIRPFLDFAFRFEIGYITLCPLQTFEGKASLLTTFLRVRPEKGQPVFLFDQARVPEIPKELQERMNWKRFHHELEHSGVVAIGEGNYYVDLALMDERNRVYRKTWQIKAHPHGKEQKAPIALADNHVTALSAPPWDGPKQNNGLKVTVLLDAAPMRPDSRKLRAWDLAFLIDSVASVLRQIPCQSVRLVAFNLDQQREIFRDDHFNRPGFYRLNRALTELELGTVNYRVLQKGQGWADLLAGLANSEITSSPPSDVVIFLGPTTRLKEKPEPEAVQRPQGRAPRFFYFQFFPYVGAEFPDSVSHLTNLCDGTTFRMHNPGELADAIKKMQRALSQEAEKRTSAYLLAH
jgi:hypothetical protein